MPIRVYGFAWFAVLGGQPVGSFGYANASAPMSAANPGLLTGPHAAVLSFQFQLSRLGVVVGERTRFKCTLELDFFHADQSTPTYQAFPRVRIAAIEWNPSPRTKVFAGQTWDVFGNGNRPDMVPHTATGSFYQAGNIGYLRPQIGWMHKFDDWALAVVAGLQDANTGPNYNFIEESFTPTGAARLMYHLKEGVIGLSAIGSSLLLENSTNTHHQRRAAAGGDIFADLTFGGFNLRTEFYLAQNVANLGGINLGQGRYGTDVADAGGYFSARYTYRNHAFMAMYGTAAVLNPSRVVPGYTAASPGPPPTPAANATGNGPGIDYNITGHIAYAYTPVGRLSVQLEPYVYSTKFKLQPSDVQRGLNDKATAWGGLAGVIYLF